MPTYDYFCEGCKIIVEVFHAISDTSPRLCTKCKQPMKKQIGTGCGFILKGEGFYRNDYKKYNEFNKPMTKEETSKCRKKRRKNSG